MDWLVFIVAIGSIPLASHMAFERNRSSRAWAWTAVLIGPLAPLTLAILGDAKLPVPAS